MLAPDFLGRGPRLTGVLLARCRNWEKIPFLEARAIGYRMGPKIDDFFPMSVTCQDLPRKVAIIRIISPIIKINIEESKQLKTLGFLH